MKRIQNAEPANFSQISWRGKILVIVILIVLTLLGVGTAYSGTMIVITCQRTQQVDCEIKYSLFGVYPVAEMQIANVLRVDYDTRTSTSTSKTKSGKRGSRTTTTYYKFIFTGEDGSRIETDENTSSFWTNKTTSRLNDFITNSTEESINAWHLEWVPMVASFCFLIMPFLVVIGMIISVFRFLSRLIINVG